MYEFGGWLWFIINVLMVFVLGAAMVYGVMRWRSAPRVSRRRDEATREVYDKAAKAEDADR